MLWLAQSLVLAMATTQAAEAPGQPILLRPLEQSRPRDDAGTRIIVAPDTSRFGECPTIAHIVDGGLRLDQAPAREGEIGLFYAFSVQAPGGCPVTVRVGDAPGANRAIGRELSPSQSGRP